jgi:hypothetical protein
MGAQKKIFGIMNVMHVELPAKDAAQQAEFDKTNAELAGRGFRTGRFGYDWGFYPFAELRKKGRPQAQRLQSGDLVQVFKSVSDGSIAWQGEISYNRKKYHHGIQKGFDLKNWATLFYSKLPARLERDGKTIYGALEPFSETGTEGSIWSISEYGKNGYDALHCLKEGDKLTVYKSVRAGEVEWEGALAFAPENVVALDRWHEVLRETQHVDTKTWLDYSFSNRPIRVMKPE